MFSWLCSASMGGSNKFTKLVSAAHATAKKNKKQNRPPNGISANTWGNVMKSSGGPESGSTPSANTAGITTMAESTAASVENSTTFLADDTTSTSFFK